MKKICASLTQCVRRVDFQWPERFVPLFIVALVLNGSLRAQVVDVEDVVWDELVRTTAVYDTPGSGSALQKTGTGSNPDATAVSNKRIEGNGFVEFHFGQTDKTCTVGPCRTQFGRCAGVHYLRDFGQLHSAIARH